MESIDKSGWSKDQHEIFDAFSKNIGEAVKGTETTVSDELKLKILDSMVDMLEYDVVAIPFGRRGGNISVDGKQVLMDLATDKELADSMLKLLKVEYRSEIWSETLRQTPITVYATCRTCGERVAIKAPMIELYKLAEGNELAQLAAPNVGPELREMFISGTCPECWDRMCGVVRARPKAEKAKGESLKERKTAAKKKMKAEKEGE